MANDRFARFQPLIVVAGVAVLLCSPWLDSSGNAANPRHRYTFNDGTIDDSIGNADGTLIDPMGIAGYNAGRVDLTANDWKGGGDPVTDGAYVDLPDGVFSTAASNGVSGAVSVETWVNVQENRENSRIWSFGDSIDGSGEKTDWVDLNGQDFGGNLALTTHEKFQVFDVSELEYSSTLPTGIRHHVVATLNKNDTLGDTNPDGTMRLYVNNVEVGTQEIEFLDLNAMNDVNNWLGRNQWGNWLFDGQIDEVVIYDDELSASEVSANFAAGPVPTPLPTFVIERNTGEIRVENQTSIDFNLKSYSITSGAGALNAAGWTSIDDNVGFDPSGVWTETAATANELAEGTTGSGGQVAATTGSWSLGPAWLQSPTEDLQATFELSDGSSGNADVSFIGNGGDALPRSDLNGSGTIDVDDWGIFLASSDTVFSDISSVQAYLLGDLDGDLDNDFFDFRIFQSDYNAVNGEGALSALLGQVPEPASLALLAMALVGLALVRRGRLSAVTAACVLVVGLSTTGIATAATDALYVASDDPNLDPDANDGSDDAWTVTFSADGNKGTYLGFGELGIGESWVMWSAPTDDVNGSLDADHAFDGGALSIGQSIQLDFANSAIAEGGSVGVSLTSGGTPVATFKYNGFDPDGVYRYDDADGSDQSTGEPFAYRVPAKLEIGLDSATSYTALFGNSAWSGTYSGTIDGLRVFNSMGGDGSDVIFNNLEIGPSTLPTTLVPLSLEVNKSTGDVQIKGNPTLAVDIDYYQIVSSLNALDPVLWDSLDEGNSPAEGWDASPNVSDSRLTEYFLLEGGATLAAGNDLPLGKAYDTSVFGAADGDLEFFYGIAGSAQLTGLVTYIGSPTTVDGDYNNSGQVEQGDLDLVLLNWGSQIPPDTVPEGWVNQPPTDDGKIDQNDLDGVLLNWGNSAAAASASAVPEPSAAVLLALGLLAARRTRSPRAARK